MLPPESPESTKSTKSRRIPMHSNNQCLAGEVASISQTLFAHFSRYSSSSRVGARSGKRGWTGLMRSSSLFSRRTRINRAHLPTQQNRQPHRLSSIKETNHDRTYAAARFASQPRSDRNPGLRFTATLIFEDAEPGHTRYTAIARHASAEGREQHALMGFHDGWGTATDQLVELASKL
jgi:Activator of Hsp90 ATPase homolog 1-like protein